MPVIIDINFRHMNTFTKTTIALLGLLTLASAGSVYAQENAQKLSQLDRDELRELRQSGDREAFQSRLQELGIDRPQRPELTDEQKETIKELKESGDRAAVRSHLDEWGIEKPDHDRKGLRKDGVFENLSEAQKEEVQALRVEGDKEAVKEKLSEFGVELPQRPQLTDDQKEKIKELKASGDRAAVKAYFEEIGLKKPRKFMQKRNEVIDTLSDDEKEVLQEARDIARAGDKQTAREIVEELFADSSIGDDSEKGIIGFFKRMFK